VLVFPAKPAHAHLSEGFDDGDLEDLSADFAARRLALLRGKIDKSLIGNRFDDAVPQQIQGKAKRSDCLCVRNALLNLRVGRSGVGANRPIIHQGPAGNFFDSASDRDFGIAEVSVWRLMTGSQF